MDPITQIIPFSVALETACEQARTLSTQTLELGAAQLMGRSNKVSARETSIAIDSAFAKAGW